MQQNRGRKERTGCRYGKLMRTLILNGSPRPQGDTAHLIQALRRELPGEVEQVDAYRTSVAPCVDCRGCFHQPGCVVRDDMDAIYQLVDGADVIVLASPLYLSTLTGSLLALCSRFQALYAGRVQGFFAPAKAKTGVVLLTAGGSTKESACALKTARIILAELGAPAQFSAVSLHTDQLPAQADQEALRQIRQIAHSLRRKQEGLPQ